MPEIHFDFTNFIYSDGEIKFKLDDEKIDILNTGIQNVVDEAREVAISLSFNRIAEGWGSPEYDEDENGIISSVKIENDEDPAGSFGLDDLFAMMETGRAGGIDIFPVHAPKMTVYFDRSRTIYWLSEHVVQGEIEPTHPIDNAIQVMHDGIEELLSDLRESRWGGYRTIHKFSKEEGRVVTTVKPRSMVRSVPNLYETYYKNPGKTTPNGVKTTAKYGNYGGKYRELDYKKKR